jgi:hypothetical protein
MKGIHECVHQVFINVGIVISYMVGAPYESHLRFLPLLGFQVAWWRIMLGLAVLPALIQVTATGCCTSKLKAQSSCHCHAFACEMQQETCCVVMFGFFTLPSYSGLFRVIQGY